MHGLETSLNYMSTCRMRNDTVHIRSLQFRFCMRNHIPTIHYNHQSKSHTCSHTALFHSNSCDSLPFHSLGMTSATILLSDPSVFDYESEVLSIENRRNKHRYHSQSNELYQFDRKDCIVSINEFHSIIIDALITRVSSRLYNVEYKSDAFVRLV